MSGWFAWLTLTDIFFNFFLFESLGVSVFSTFSGNHSEQCFFSMVHSFARQLFLTLEQFFRICNFFPPAACVSRLILTVLVLGPSAHFNPPSGNFPKTFWGGGLDSKGPVFFSPFRSCTPLLAKFFFASGGAASCSISFRSLRNILKSFFQRNAERNPPPLPQMDPSPTFSRPLFCVPSWSPGPCAFFPPRTCGACALAFHLLAHSFF